MQWLSRGYCRQGQAFFLGMSLFLGIGPQEAHYRLRFREKTHGTCTASRGAFLCGNRQELFLSTFMQGSLDKLVVPWKDRRLILIRGNPSPLRLESLVALLPAMFSQLVDLFGGADFRELSFFFFSRDDPNAGMDMGTGLSVHRGVLLVFPARVRRLDLPQHLWLILHESLHQWLGVGLRAGETGLEWFFEGFTCFFTLILLQRAGLINEEYVRMVTRLNLDAYQAAARRIISKEGQPPDPRGEFQYRFHGGFFLAWLWDADLKSVKQGDLAGWMQAFYQRHRGGVFDARSLVAALEESSGGRLPEYFYGFLNRAQVLPLANVLKYLDSPPE